MTEHKISMLTKELMTALSAAGRSFDDHSIFSPSGSAMWANCSGSLIPNLFCSDTAGLDAATGTVAHSVGETWLRSGIRPDHLIGTKVQMSEGESSFEIEIDHAMMEFVGQYVDWGIYLPGTHFVETRVDFSDLTPLKRQTGTADHAVCEIGKLTITDLKFGQGVQVFAKENTQGVLYAYGFFKKYDELFDFQTIVIRIAQPRLNHFDEWVITRDELLQWAAWLKARAYAAWCKDAVRTPSAKACKWCRIAPDCAAHAVFVERLVDGAFDNLDEPITTDEMLQIGEYLAACLVDLDTRQTISSMDVICRPDGWTIPDNIAAIHGINTELAMDVGIPESLAVSMFMEMWGGRLRIAHNQQFDARILRIALMRFKDDQTADKWKAGTAECTALLATPICKIPPTPKMVAAGLNKFKTANLGEAYRHFTGKELQNAHSAMADVQGCMEVYFAIKNWEAA